MIPDKKIVIALAGNANVGKSVIFNYLTGLHQHIGNWPGKTVEKAEGTLHYKGYTIDIIDLPGIYSLSTYSLEEIVSRDYIAIDKPDIVINVVDASVLERNLFFTIQLLELETPLIIALNQADMAEKKGIEINTTKLQKLFGVPAILTIAVKGIGIYKLIDKAIEVIEGKEKLKPVKIEYSTELEKRVQKILPLIEKIKIKYPPRWVAIKLLEGDEEITKKARSQDKSIIIAVKILSEELEKIFNEETSTLVTSERYNIVNRAVAQAQNITEPKSSWVEKLDDITTHKIYGYPIMILVLASLLVWTFTIGGWLSTWLSDIFANLESVEPNVSGPIMDVLWNGAFAGLVAGVTLVIPFVLPFYLILTIIEDSGYLTRIAFLMDNAMHKMGLHGKAIIPLILGYGCNVPAIFACRIMETNRERLIAAFVVTLIPCAAVTIVVLGLVAAFVSIQWALALYILNIFFIFILGRLAFKALPGEPTGLIMEIPPYRKPILSNIAKQTWTRTKSLVYFVFPIYIIGSAGIQILYVLGIIEPIGDAMSPLTVTWLGLPAITGVLLIFGLIRKELIIIMLATMFSTTNFAEVLSSNQMIVFAIVTMLYIPCIATIGTLVKEFGWKQALYITIFEIGFAIFIGGLAFRLLGFIM